MFGRQSLKATIVATTTSLSRTQLDKQRRCIGRPAPGGLTLCFCWLLQGTHLHTALGKEFMPGFGNGYSDAEIAAVVNFVTTAD